MGSNGEEGEDFDPQRSFSPGKSPTNGFFSISTLSYWKVHGPHEICLNIECDSWIYSRKFHQTFVEGRDPEKVVVTAFFLRAWKTIYFAETSLARSA